MERHDSLDPARPARSAALKAIGRVVSLHLRHETDHLILRSDAASPLLIHVDGPGKSELLGTLAGLLDPVVPLRKGQHTDTKAEPWSAVWFDAWQHQRVAPPWWWLITELDRQTRVRARRRGRRAWLVNRGRDWAYRGVLFLRDAAWVVVWLALLAVGWRVSHLDMSHFAAWILKSLGTLAAAVGAFTALLAFGSSLVNALRRHMLADSPAGAAALLRKSDPMAEIRRRYEFLLRTAGTPVLVLIDNLDRCRAEYVVEMLEGLQTLLRLPPPKPRGRFARRDPAPLPLIAFVVAADQAWLCESYLRVYQDFAATAHDPGRPFGLAFLDKIFDVSLRVPVVPAAVGDDVEPPGRRPFRHSHTEHAVRRRLRTLERAASGGGSPETVPPPSHALRIAAVKRIGKLEVREKAEYRQCGDTAGVLMALMTAADLGPAVSKHLRTAYCAERTTQLLGAHAVDDDDDAVRRLGLWTLIGLRWPLLADHLRARPQDLMLLRTGTAPADAAEDVAPVFSAPAAVHLARGLDGPPLTPEDIRRFTTPLVTGSVGAPAHSNGHASLTNGSIRAARPAWAQPAPQREPVTGRS